MELHVVWDTKGEGRLVGVFSTAARAERIAAVHPGYFRVHRMRLDAVNPEAAAWACDPEERRRLEAALRISPP